MAAIEVSSLRMRYGRVVAVDVSFTVLDRLGLAGPADRTDHEPTGEDAR